MYKVKCVIEHIYKLECGVHRSSAVEEIKLG